MAKDERPVKPSVFGEVDQEEMIRRLTEAAPDEVETTFFDAAVQESDAQSRDRLLAGIRAFTGVEVREAVEPTAPEAAREPSRGPAIALPAPEPPVVVAGPLEAEPAAVRAFVLFGPAGIARPRPEQPTHRPGIVRRRQRKGPGP